MNKVIFLNIDDVMNCLDTFIKHKGYLGIDPKFVKRFNKIIERTGAKNEIINYLGEE